MLLARLPLLTLIGAIHNAVRANNGYTIINRVDVTVWSVSGGPDSRKEHYHFFTDFFRSKIK